MSHFGTLLQLFEEIIKENPIFWDKVCHNFNLSSWNFVPLDAILVVLTTNTITILVHLGQLMKMEFLSAKSSRSLWEKVKSPWALLLNPFPYNHKWPAWTERIGVGWGERKSSEELISGTASVWVWAWVYFKVFTTSDKQISRTNYSFQGAN